MSRGSSVDLLSWAKHPIHSGLYWWNIRFTGEIAMPKSCVLLAPHHPFGCPHCGDNKRHLGKNLLPFPQQAGPGHPAHRDTLKSRGNDAKWGWESQQQTPVRNTCVCLATETVEDSWHGRLVHVVICTDSGWFLEDSLRSLAVTSALCSLLYHSFPLSFLSAFKFISSFFGSSPSFGLYSREVEHGDARLAPAAFGHRWHEHMKSRSCVLASEEFEMCLCI